MVDAARLAQPVGDDILWHPARLDDVLDVPSRTLLLFDFFRLGSQTRQSPWSWWRVEGTRAICHQYQIDWQATPEPPARCGFVPEGRLERYDVGHCSRCEQLDRGEPQQATGTVAGVKVGALPEGRGQGRRQGHP
jgi:hypothetical protein